MQRATASNPPDFSAAFAPTSAMKSRAADMAEVYVASAKRIEMCRVNRIWKIYAGNPYLIIHNTYM